jgi:alanine-synthesizing transaminase
MTTTFALPAIPFNRPFMVGTELDHVREAHRRLQLAGDGHFTSLCSEWLERRTGCRTALLTHSCTAALEMAAILADIGPGDEIVMPSYTFVSTANAFVLRGGLPVFVDVRPDTLNIDESKIEAAITERTRAIVVINPNNPTGALYPQDLLREIVELARQHQLIVFADEIYDKTLYDGNVHTSIASLADDVLFVTFNGLSKNYRSCGYRAGWMIVSGEKRHARDYIEGLDMLASMRLCSNTPGQFAIQTALGGHQSIADLVAPGGRLCRQRDMAYEMLSQIPGVSVVKPKAALYMFPRLDPKVYPIEDDQQFAYELLADEKLLIVQGTGFNWPSPDHFRLVFLPNADDLRDALTRIERFLGTYRRRHLR